MLTTLVVAVTALTCLSSVVVLATMNVNAHENFWDPRRPFVAAAGLVRSCLAHSQLLMSGCWSQVSRASRAAKTGFSQRISRVG